VFCQFGSFERKNNWRVLTDMLVIQGRKMGMEGIPASIAWVAIVARAFFLGHSVPRFKALLVY